MKSRRFIITKRVEATSARSAIAKERGDILSIVEEKPKTKPPEDYTPAIGFGLQADDEPDWSS